MKKLRIEQSCVCQFLHYLLFGELVIRLAESGKADLLRPLSDCKSSLIAGISMMAAITRLIIGSMMCRPVLDITRPEMRTPTETSVSDTICRKEALMLISRS